MPKIEVDISEEAAEMLINVFGEPPDNPDDPIDRDEWLSAVATRMFERYVEKGQHRTGKPVQALLGDNADHLVKRAEKARKRKAERERAQQLREEATELDEKANAPDDDDDDY